MDGIELAQERGVFSSQTHGLVFQHIQYVIVSNFIKILKFYSLRMY